jgi:hypothetical protein
MSHVVDCNFYINDLDALEAAARRLGGKLNRGKKRYRWYGRDVGDYKNPTGRESSDLGTCEHELEFEGCGYSVGVIKRADGKPGYDLEYDFWSGGKGLVERIGKDAGKLRQAYGVVRAKRALAAKGVAVSAMQEKTLPNGQIQLVVQA